MEFDVLQERGLNDGWEEMFPELALLEPPSPAYSLQEREAAIQIAQTRDGIEFQSKITEYIRSLRNLFDSIRSKNKRITPQSLLALCDKFGLGAIVGVFPKRIKAIRLLLQTGNQTIPKLSGDPVQIILDCLHCQTDFAISEMNNVQSEQSKYSNAEVHGRPCRMFALEDGFVEECGGNWSQRERAVHQVNSGNFHCPYVARNIEKTDVSKLPDARNLTPFLKQVGVRFGLSEKFQDESMGDCQVSFLYNFTKNRKLGGTIILSFPFYDKTNKTIGALSCQKMVKIPKYTSLTQIQKYLKIVKNTFSPVGEQYIIKSMRE